jgi:AcrR family transcriptional regulator
VAEELRAGRRLSTEERREQLLASGAALLGRRPYDEVSIEEIAAAAGVSNTLLYHYFPTKTDFLLAALERGQRELAELTAPDPELPPAEQLAASLDRFLDFVEEHEAAYTAIFRSRGSSDAAIAAALDQGRQRRMDELIASLQGWEGAPAIVGRSPALETAVQGWFFFLEGAVLRWLEQRDLEREQLRELLGLALMGSLGAAEVVGSADWVPGK